MKIVNFSIFLIASLSINLKAQVLIPGDFERDYYELLLLKNYDDLVRPISINPSIITQYSTDSTLKWDLWNQKIQLISNKTNSNLNIKWVNPRISLNYNSQYPRGYNDGPVWNGRGLSSNLTGGLTGQVGILHFSFVPVLSYSQNKYFHIPSSNANKSPFSYPFNYKIDWVQRYGEGSYYDFHPGQSEIRLIYKNATIGLSSENLSWGPSRYNPILLSNNAAGFPHIDIGTAKPSRTKIGNIEYKIYWGKLVESDYFDNDVDNDRKYLTGWSFGYEPIWIKGLSLGLNRIMYTKWGPNDLSWKDIFASFTENSHNDFAKNDEYDQMMSASIKYTFPSVGFEAYLEYARNDFPGNFNDLFEAPDRSRARTIGVMKSFDFANGKILKIVYENSVLSANQTQLIWPIGSPTYYVHSVVPNGYAHNGQLLGAGMGPGSNSDILKAYLYQSSGRIGFQFQRIRFNDDYFVKNYPEDNDPEGIIPVDYEVSLGIDYVRHFDKFSLQPELIWSYRKNFYYQDDVEISNFYLSIKASYSLNR